MPWRQRFIEYLEREQDDLRRRIGVLQTGKCQMWEQGDDGGRRDVTQEYAADLQTRLAEIEKILIEEGLS
jgi:hypothetical protein